MKRLSRCFVPIFLLLLLLSGCMGPRQVNYLQTGRGIPDYTDTVAFTDYILQRGDYLYIKVFSLNTSDMMIFNGDNNQTSYSPTYGDNASSRLYLYLVGEDGSIDYPFVGKVPVVGKNLREVKELVEWLLDEMMTSYSVEVKLANKTFSVIGESSTGRYVLNKEKVTIYEALAMSGDLKLYAKRQKIHVIRQTENGTAVKTFDIRSKSIIDSEFYYIQPNDVIYVPFTNSRSMGVNSVGEALGFTFSVVSLGFLIYSIVTAIKTTLK